MSHAGYRVLWNSHGRLNPCLSHEATWHFSRDRLPAPPISGCNHTTPSPTNSMEPCPDYPWSCVQITPSSHNAPGMSQGEILHCWQFHYRQAEAEKTAHLQSSISLDSPANQIPVFVTLILTTGAQNHSNEDVAFFFFCGHVVTVRQGLLTSVAWHRAYLANILHSSNAGSTTPSFLDTF